jgi:serine/threonine protein kinase
MTKMGGPSAIPPARPPLELAPGIAVGRVIADKYRVDGVIGKGGMGVVLAATQLALERTVAIKVIRGEWAEDTQAMARLLREARAAASIKSEHVARVLDVGTLESGAPFIVMEHLEGVDLDTLLTRSGPLPVPEAIDYILQACEAIAEAHRNGIVHRDLKPANLFVARLPGGASTIKVVDFGISKSIGSPALESLTDPSRVVGSLYHMAPEQMRGQPVDARTDVWAIGVVLFELLTGRKPFLEGGWPAVCAQVLNEHAPALGVIGSSVPAELDAIVQRCLRRSSSERFPNVAELAVALSAFGSRGARSSLEQIVRLATSTGSLSADHVTRPPPDTREISSVERVADVADVAPVESARLEPTVVAASPPRAAATPARPSAQRDRRWRVLATAAVAAAALALWLAPNPERSAPADPRTSIERLAPESSRTPEAARTSLPGTAAPAASGSAAEPVSAAATAAAAPAPTAASADSTATAASATTSTPRAATLPAATPPAATPPASREHAASTPRAPEPTIATPAASAPTPAPASAPAATTASTAQLPPSAEASALGDPALTSPAPKPAAGSAWDLSDIDFKELPE